MALVKASAVSVSSRAFAGRLAEKFAPPRRTWYHSESLSRLTRAVLLASASSVHHAAAEEGGGTRH